LCSKFHLERALKNKIEKKRKGRSPCENQAEAQPAPRPVIPTPASRAAQPFRPRARPARRPLLSLSDRAGPPISGRLLFLLAPCSSRTRFHPNQSWDSRFPCPFHEPRPYKVYSPEPQPSFASKSRVKALDDVTYAARDLAENLHRGESSLLLP